MPPLQEASMEMMDVAYLKGREADKNLNVIFSYEPHLNQAKSEEQGRPIFDDCEYVEIRVPGDKDSIVKRPVRDMDRRRFSDRYREFKEKREQTQSGTPLTAVAWLSRGRIEELKFFNIHTLEQLANLSDANAAKFMGINTLRQNARDHLTAAAEGAPLIKMRAEIEAKDSEIAALRESISEQGKVLVAMQKQMHAFVQRSDLLPGTAQAAAAMPEDVAPPMPSPRPMAQVPGGKNAASK